MYNKDEMLRLTYQIEKNILSYFEGNEDGTDDIDNYFRTKKRKGDEVEKVLNTRIQEYWNDIEYKLPMDFVALWTFLLADFHIAEGQSSGDILKALKPATKSLNKKIPVEVIEKLRLGLEVTYNRLPEVNPNDIPSRIDHQINVIQENYRLNQMKLISKQRLTKAFMELCDTSFGVPNQYILDSSSKSESSELYPLGELSIDHQIHYLEKLTQELVDQIESWKY